MKLSASKNQKLLRQYPFLKDFLILQLEPVGGIDGTNVDDLTIKVQKADADLMFRQANNVGLGDNTFSVAFNDMRKNQVMRRGEYVSAVSVGGRILRTMAWPRNDAERTKNASELYARMVLWKTRFANNHFADPIWDDTEWLVWTRVEAWHVDTKNDDAPESRFGDFVERHVHLTLYGKPTCGFEKLFNESNVYQHLHVNNRLLLRGAMRKDQDLITMSGMLYEMCQQFQDEVYTNGMKEVLDKGKVRGASGQFGQVKVLCAELCGYDRIMLEDSVSFVSFQLRPGSTNLYVLCEGGTLPQIRNLVRTVVKMWNGNPEARATFKPDEQVSVW